MEPEALIGFVGGGKVGRTLGRLLSPRFRIAYASHRGAEQAAEFAGGGARTASLAEIAVESDCVVLAVPDRLLPTVAGNLAEHRPGVVLHTCGSVGPSGLAPLPTLGVACATWHPLQTFPSAGDGLARLPGSTFGVSGDPAAKQWAERLSARLDCSVLHVPEEHLALYHAAAVMASNCTVALVDVAVGLLEQIGASADQARDSMRPLMLSSVQNALTMGAGHALTGPIVRGDAVTVQRHLDALRTGQQAPRALYEAFARHLLDVAARQGLPHRSAAAVRRVLDGMPGPE